MASAFKHDHTCSQKVVLPACIVSELLPEIYLQVPSPCRNIHGTLSCATLSLFYYHGIEPGSFRHATLASWPVQTEDSIK